MSYARAKLEHCNGIGRDVSGTAHYYMDEELRVAYRDIFRGLTQIRKILKKRKGKD